MSDENTQAETLPGQAPPAAERHPVWTGWDVLAIVAFTLFAIVALFFVAFGLAMAVAGTRGAPAEEIAKDARLIVGVQTLAYVLVVAFMYLLLRLRYGRGLGEALQWNWERAQQTWTAFLLGGVVLGLAVQFVSRYLPIPKRLPIEELFRDATSAWMLAGFGILVAPLVEELFYRGFLYPVLARRAGVAGGIVLTSVFFSLMHISQLAAAWAPLLLLFSVSVALTVARVLTRSVAVPYLMHVGYNLILFAMVYAATDGFRHMERLKG